MAKFETPSGAEVNSLLPLPQHVRSSRRFSSPPPLSVSFLFRCIHQTSFFKERVSKKDRMYKAKSGVRRRGRAFTEHKLADAARAVPCIRSRTPYTHFPHRPRGSPLSLFLSVERERDRERIEREREDGAGRRPAPACRGGLRIHGARERHPMRGSE